VGEEAVENPGGRLRARADLPGGVEADQQEAGMTGVDRQRALGRHFSRDRKALLDDALGKDQAAEEGGEKHKAFRHGQKADRPHHQVVRRVGNVVHGHQHEEEATQHIQAHVALGLGQGRRNRGRFFHLMCDHRRRAEP